MMLFPGTLSAANYGGSSAQSLHQGWNIPGRHYKTGDGWWILACKDKCTLTSASMTVTPSTHPDYDGPPLVSQLLRWSPKPFGSAISPTVGDTTNKSLGTAILLALFKPLRGLANLPLHAGPITTWLHAGMDSYPATRVETMDVLIDMGKAGKATLVPRIFSSASGNSLDRDREPTLILGLRADGKRQQLGPYTWHLGSRALAGKDYLIWAGDLDGDGKLDLLMNFTDYFWGTTLFLSSLAKPGELVGAAGHFNYSPPDSPGC
jgi:hypothetical protein